MLVTTKSPKPRMVERVRDAIARWPDVASPAPALPTVIVQVPAPASPAVTGPELADEVVAFCRREAISQKAFLRFAGHAESALLSVRRATVPSEATIGWVRNAIARWKAGERGAQHVTLAAELAREEIERRRAEVEAAYEARLTNAQAVARREREEAAARRARLAQSVTA